MTGLPRLPKPPFRRAVPTTPADRAGAHVDCFPAHAAFPKWQEGRHPHWDFRGLLGLHSCYGPLNCSTAHGGLCHEASTQMVAHPSRSSATGAIDNSPGGSYRHWRHTHTGRTVESRTGAVAWAMWQHSVSCPRSSNRTCRFPASGFPTSFIVRHTEKSSGRKRPLRGGFFSFALRYSFL